jgi:hypothetical protein
MSKNAKRILLGLGAGLGLLAFGISGVEAGQLMKKGQTDLVPFSSYSAKQNSYKVAYEFYQPGGTVTSTQKTVIAISFNQTEISDGQVGAPFTVTFSFPDNNAEFAISGSNYIWVLTNNSTTVNATTIFAASEPGANGPSISLSSGKLANPSNMTAGTYYLMQVQWTDNDTDGARGLIDGNDTFSNPTNPVINLKNIQASCSGSVPWKLAASISGANGNIGFPQASFAYVTPQYSFLAPTGLNFNAELDVDTNFATFVYPQSNSNVANNVSIRSTLNIGITDNFDVDPYNWIVWSSGQIFNVNFTLSSLNSEPGVKDITYCSKVNDSTWNCALSNVSGGNFPINLTLDGTTKNNFTEWSLSNYTVASPTNISICPTPSFTQSIGKWWGGVEAIVPFVKSDRANGAQTYIVLYNRRNVPADVYATALLKNSDKLVVPKTKVATIPAQGTIKLTADDLKNSLSDELGDYDMSKGVPIKFLVYVPSVPNTGADPYVEGIVVSVYGNTQRTVPLKFRQGRHGDYTE